MHALSKWSQHSSSVAPTSREKNTLCASESRSGRKTQPSIPCFYAYLRKCDITLAEQQQSRARKKNDTIYNNSRRMRHRNPHSERELYYLVYLYRWMVGWSSYGMSYALFHFHLRSTKNWREPETKQKKCHICEKAFPKINCDFTDSCFLFTHSIPFFLFRIFFFLSLSPSLALASI